MKVLDLFSGIGGFSLGLERAGFSTVAFCEIDPFCQKVLKKHWPDVPIYTDIKEFRGDEIRADVICGGFPCQPFSTASRGRRTAIDLWPEMARIIRENKPRIVIAENVAINPINTAKHFLESLGYRVTTKNISAHDAGADHERVRWWLIAHPYDESEFLRTLDAKVAMLPELCQGVWGWENFARAIRVSYGVPGGMDRTKSDRIRSLGNTVVPQIPEIIGRAIMEAEA